MDQLIAFHNDPALKQQMLDFAEEHRKADAVIRGTYSKAGKTFRGCSVGCSLESYRLIMKLPAIGFSHSNHADYEPFFGVPMILARLQDGVFEGLPDPDHLAWTTQFWSAIPVGADLSGVWPRFAVALLADSEHGVIRFAQNDQQRTAIQSVVSAYQRIADGGVVDVNEWQFIRSNAADAAAYAAAYAADAADAARAARAADAAAYAAADAAADAADAADAAADAAAYAAAYAAYAADAARAARAAYAAARAAYAAARAAADAADAARAARAARAAYAAARAAYAAARAAYAADAARAAYAAARAARRWQRDTLIKLLSEAPIAVPA